jgi:hypothetical protein
MVQEALKRESKSIHVINASGTLHGLGSVGGRAFYNSQAEIAADIASSIEEANNLIDAMQYKVPPETRVQQRQQILNLLGLGPFIRV